MKTVRTSRTVRAALLASAAGFCLTLAAGSAQAAEDPISDGTVLRPLLTDALREAQGSRISGADVVREAQTDRLSIIDAQREAQFSGPRVTPVAPEPQIVIANPPPAPGQTPNTTVTDRDPTVITGIGQMIVDEGGGFVGLCTGTLINPRTVIFAAHCVNGSDVTNIVPATAYGADSGGVGIGFGFRSANNSTIPGHAPGTSPLLDWLLPGAGQYQTNRDNAFYNVNQVRYNPLSVETNADSFLYGDVAMASFDTPTKDIPTWALLFSQLPDPGTIGAAGTGYHVSIAGYGNNGTASTGSSGGIDFRRRLAENMLGGLASLDEFENFLFGGNASNNPQNLYWIDFDDPNRTNVNDFNAWRDNAVPGTATRPSQEGITASGDSGGPLILDNTYAKAVVIGVLSGGYTRFFSPAQQPANGYGTASFYQPLYLYWDWIAANNPYHYVSAVQGNGNWTDPNHWVTQLDPSYQIILNGALANGVPDAPGAGNTEQDGFGQACLQGPSRAVGNVSVSDCLDIATGDETIGPGPVGNSGSNGASNDRGSATIGGLTNGATSQAVGDGAGSGNGGSQGTAAVSQPLATLPAATLANGLPGATGFVPNNVDPVRTTGAIGKYFDVTLTAAGTTTLNSAVTIDRFSIGIGGGNVVLDIQSGGSLTSLLDITQATGTIHANGALITPGDYMMVTGGLDGTGTVTANYFTNMAGTIAPGTAGTTGTLTFRGNVGLASASRYAADLGANGVSDRIAVVANGTGTGVAGISGLLALNLLPSARAGNNYTIMTAVGGGLTGTVDSRVTVGGGTTAILTPKVTYSDTAVSVQLIAGLYGNVIDTSNPIQYSYAILLDRNRSQAANYDGLYGPLDLQDKATIRATLSALAPTTETLGQSLAIAGVDNWSNLIRTRIDGIQQGDNGGTLARYGAPAQVAANGINALSMGGMGAMGFGSDVRSDAQQPMVQENVLPESVNAFLAGGYLTGDSTPMAGIAGRDDYNGWYAAAGVESSDDSATVGFALSYTRLDGDGAMAGQSAHANLFQGSLYGKADFGGITLDAMMTAGLLNLHTARAVSFVGTPYTIRGDNNSLVFVSEVGLSKDFDLGAVRVTPRVAGRAAHIGFSRSEETGGPMALMINRSPAESVEARGGLTIAGTGKVKPFVNGTIVHDFEDRPAVLSANFVGGIGGNVLFALNGQDHDWAEVSGGLTYDSGNIALSVSAETTIERQDLSSQAYRGSISFKF